MFTVSDMLAFSALLDLHPYPLQSYWNEDENTYTYTLNVPGASNEDISIRIVSNSVEIDVKLPTGKSKKTFDFPEEADLESCRASVKNGVLTVQTDKFAKNIKEIPVAVG